MIHSDVCGPMSSSSLSGYVYYVYFIDDFFRKTWIYFLKNKDEVFSKFKEFKSLIENQIENKIKTFRSDNGEEFTSNEFKELCRDQMNCLIFISMTVTFCNAYTSVMHIYEKYMVIFPILLETSLNSKATRSSTYPDT